MLSLTTLFHISPNNQALPSVEQRSPKGKAEGLTDICTKLILGNRCLSMELGKVEKSCRCRDSAQQSRSKAIPLFPNTPGTQLQAARLQ